MNLLPVSVLQLILVPDDFLCVHQRIQCNASIKINQAVACSLPNDFSQVISEVADSQKATSSTLPEDFLRVNTSAVGQ